MRNKCGWAAATKDPGLTEIEEDLGVIAEFLQGLPSAKLEQLRTPKDGTDGIVLGPGGLIGRKCY